MNASCCRTASFASCACCSRDWIGLLLCWLQGRIGCTLCSCSCVRSFILCWIPSACGTVLSSISSPGCFLLCCSNCIKRYILCSTPTGSCRICNFTRFLLGRTCCLRNNLLCTLPCVSYRLGSGIGCASNLFLRGICSLVRLLLRGLLRTLSSIC